MAVAAFRRLRESQALSNPALYQSVQRVLYSALVPGGIRMGTPALTSRGFSEDDFVKVAEYFDQAVQLPVKTKAATKGTIRHLNIFTVFNKEAREKERARLKDELNRGYFDDFRELKKTGGKVAIASQNLVPVLAAGKFPSLTTYTKVGDFISLPITENDNPSVRATVICMAFRASAQNMIESWTKPLSTSFEPSASIELFEVSLVDSWFLSLPPVKRVMLRLMRAPELVEGEQSIKKRLVYAFGDTYFFRKELQIPNVLAGYMFLVDRKGRIRWRASGMATTEELSSMVSCIRRLLEED